MAEAVDMGAYELQTTPFDTDGDGMLDAWEVEYFGHITNGIPDAHDDADIFYTLQEFIAGTDPTNAASYFSVSNSVDSDFIVHWPAISNRYYDVFWSTNLTTGFQPLETDLEYPRNSVTSSVLDAEFYKVNVRLK